jgi:nitroimidazol reductase NimA-like FMN-containing flavoprotein (pyridoxamine 5'-phosphate oxidase superfamily)
MASTTSKKNPKKIVNNQEGGPKASRPYFDSTYGIPKHNKGLLPWSHVSERMAQAKFYWVSTVSPEGHPHATPVDGVWMDDKLYFGGSPKTRRNRNIVANPAVCIHLESGSDVVILHGEAHALGKVDRELAVRLSAANEEKYGYGTKPEDYEARGAGTFVFQPHIVFAWKEFAKDSTRWEFE